MKHERESLSRFSGREHTHSWATRNLHRDWKFREVNERERDSSNSVRFKFTYRNKIMLKNIVLFAFPTTFRCSLKQNMFACLFIYLFIYLSTSQIQLYGFNAELYHNMSEAQHKAQGIVGISLMVQIGETPNPELRIITSTFNKVLHKGELKTLKQFVSATLSALSNLV